MKNKLFLLVAVLCFFTTLPSFAQMSTDAKRFRSTCLRYLNAEGYNAFIDDDDDLQWKYGGNTYWISFGDGDNTTVYGEMHISPWNIEGKNRRNVLETANYINGNKKCVKAYAGEKYMVFTIEIFAYDASDFVKTLRRCMTALESCVSSAKSYYNDL